MKTKKYTEDQYNKSLELVNSLIESSATVATYDSITMIDVCRENISQVFQISYEKAKIDYVTEFGKETSITKDQFEEARDIIKWVAKKNESADISPQEEEEEKEEEEEEGKEKKTITQETIFVEEEEHLHKKSLIEKTERSVDESDTRSQDTEACKESAIEISQRTKNNRYADRAAQNLKKGPSTAQIEWEKYITIYDRAVGIGGGTKEITDKMNEFLKKTLTPEQRSDIKEYTKNHQRLAIKGKKMNIVEKIMKMLA